jgi:hypothetical protein
MTGGLLSDAADYFKTRQTAIDAWYDDNRGRYAFRVTVHDQAFIVTAKQYLKAGDASFMHTKVAQRATDTDALLLLFVQDGGYRYVFHPKAVTEHGDAPDPDDSPRQRRGEDWIDINARFGVPFRDWADGRKTPPRHPDWTPSTDGSPGQQNMNAFQGGDGDG